ncbi:MAG: hypothetical protein WCA12_01260 [Burkholderiales bacterium]
MNRIALVLGLVLAAASLSAGAQPGPQGPRRGEFGGPMHREVPGPERRGEMRDFRGPGDMRDFRGQGEMRRHGHLSPEERQQLRRDINDAGRELYREPPGRRWQQDRSP